MYALNVDSNPTFTAQSKKKIRARQVLGRPCKCSINGQVEERKKVSWEIILRNLGEFSDSVVRTQCFPCQGSGLNSWSGSFPQAIGHRQKKKKKKFGFCSKYEGKSLD